MIKELINTDLLPIFYLRFNKGSFYDLNPTMQFLFTVSLRITYASEFKKMGGDYACMIKQREQCDTMTSSRTGDVASQL
ncbi:hypothetical protein VIRA109638_14885 [Vibrio rarus]